MGPTIAIKTCLGKSFQFKGRASLSKFWSCASLGLVSAGFVTAVQAPFTHHKPEIFAAICILTLVSLPVWAGASLLLRNRGQQQKIVCLLLALSALHLGFAQLFVRGTGLSSGVFELLFEAYDYAGFLLLTLLNLALFVAILLICALAAPRAHLPKEVLQ